MGIEPPYGASGGKSGVALIYGKATRREGGHSDLGGAKKASDPFNCLTQMLLVAHIEEVVCAPCNVSLEHGCMCPLCVYYFCNFRGNGFTQAKDALA